MRQAIIARPGMRLLLGRQGENNVQPVWFPAREWREKYGVGTLTLFHQRSGDEQGYPISLTVGDEYAEWLVSSGDTAVPGVGRCGLIYTVGGAVAKSALWETYVTEAVDGSGDPPPPWESWVQGIRDELSKVTGMTVEAETLSAGSPATVVKTEGEVVNLAFGIPRGQKGSKGDKGDPGNLKSVTASIDAQTGTPYISVDYDDGNVDFAFHNCKGSKGDSGKTAYESAQDGGYADTEPQFNHDLANISEKYVKPPGGIPQSDLDASDYSTSEIDEIFDGTV